MKFRNMVLIVAALLTGLLSTSVTFSAPKSSPVKALSDRDVYYPGSEDLAPDEMRVTACGTGMPNARPKQAAACWLVELGNGDKFLFDIGTGSAERIAAMKIPYRADSRSARVRNAANRALIVDRPLHWTRRVRPCARQRVSNLPLSPRFAPTGSL